MAIRRSARIRNVQREAARRRMMAEVPKADVIVTNPTHYAVALRYHGDSMRAQVAKGAHLLAQRIREIGEQHVPVLEAPAGARHHTELGRNRDALYHGRRTWPTCSSCATTRSAGCWLRAGALAGSRES